MNVSIHFPCLLVPLGHLNFYTWQRGRLGFLRDCYGLARQIPRRYSIVPPDPVIGTHNIIFVS